MKAPALSRGARGPGDTDEPGSPPPRVPVRLRVGVRGPPHSDAATERWAERPPLGPLGGDR